MIGLDGADGPFLSRLFADGLCPALARLAGEYGIQNLSRPVGWSDDAVWTGFTTGLNMGEHGRFHGPYQLAPGSYQERPFAEHP